MMNLKEYIYFFSIALIATAIFMFVLTGCVSPRYHRLRILEERLKVSTKYETYLDHLEKDCRCYCGEEDKPKRKASIREWGK